MSGAKGVFITLEGGEGVGKSTLIEGLAARFVAAGRDVVVTREPGGTALGDQVREWLLRRDEAAAVGPIAELLLFLAARAQHVDEVIRPALSRGKVVLCDRFNDSTVVYQGYGRQLGPQRVRQLCDAVTEGLTPQVTLVLDLDPREGLARVRRRAANAVVDRFEEEAMAFHYRVREGFLEIAKAEPERCVLLDASQPRRSSR